MNASKAHSQKRVFFGFKVITDWPTELPRGRLVPEACRHVTFAFLGEVAWEKLKPQLNDIPLPPSSTSSARFTGTLFLPPDRPRVVAWELQFSDARILSYQQRLSLTLQGLGYEREERPFLPHMTIARAPFVPEEWAAFPLPEKVVKLEGLHLFESLGNMQYQSLWHT